jgi:uncharacterized membrane-anchored protein
MIATSCWSENERYNRLTWPLAVLIALLAWLAQTLPAQAQAPTGPALAAARRMERSLRYHRGRVSVEPGLATMVVPDGYRYLDAAEARRVLRFLGTEPPADLKGLVYRDDVSIFHEQSFTVFLQYEAMGFVADPDAADLDADDWLDYLREQTALANAEQRSQGLPESWLVDWSEPPRYDEQRHQLSFAIETAYSDISQHGLEFHVRCFGRGGQIVLSTTVAASRKGDIAGRMQALARAVSFDVGQRYEDYRPTDEGLPGADPTEASLTAWSGRLAGAAAAVLVAANGLGLVLIACLFWQLRPARRLSAASPSRSGGPR